MSRNREREERELHEIRNLPPMRENNKSRITSSPISEFHDELRRREEEIEKNWHARNRRILAHTIIVAAILVAALSFTSLATTGAVIQKPLTGDDVLKELSSLEEAKPYAGMPADVTLLSFGDVKKLAEEAPVIYGDISGSVWQAVFHGESSDVLILYDSSAKRILKTFEVTSLNI